MQPVILTLLAATFLVGCAGKPIRKEPFSALEPTAPDSTLVYFYRPKAFTAGGVWYEVSISGRTVASLANCSFSVARLQPGQFRLDSVPHPAISGNPKPIDVSMHVGVRQFFLLDVDGSFAAVPSVSGASPYGFAKLSWKETSEKDALALMSGCNRVEGP